MISAKIICDSINNYGNRLTTFELRYPRFIHAEFMTHRTFCLSGDSELEFDLPAGTKNHKYKRIHKMSIKEFVNKWHRGVKKHKASRFLDIILSDIDAEKIYSAKELAKILNLAVGNIRNYCRDKKLKSLNFEKRRVDDYQIKGSDYIKFRNLSGTRTFSIKDRLSKMQIRQLNEDTGLIEVSEVEDCCFSGIKDVYTVSTKNFAVSGSLQHQILTLNGWKIINDIIPNKDYICVEKFGKFDDEKLDPIRLKKINGKWRSTWQNQIRKSLLEKQNYCCANCNNNIEVENEIHHIIPVYQNLNLAFNINNVKLICKQCHKNEHNKQDWQRNKYLYGDFELVNSIVYKGKEETFDLKIKGKYPNFIANGVVVHNSRNASSSRAIPTKKYIEEVSNELTRATPIYWGLNKAGMQANEELTGNDLEVAKQIWEDAAMDAVKHATRFAALKAHKQFANRILEPFTHINVVCSATEYNNFFALRLHKDAQPEIRELAKQMWKNYNNSKPKLIAYGDWHLPYIEDTILKQSNMDVAIKVSVARCARVSYKSFTTGKVSTIDEDLDLYNKLLGQQPIHASPAEHQATPDLKDARLYLWQHPELWGNFKGWKQFRKTIPNECITDISKIPNFENEKV